MSPKKNVIDESCPEIGFYWDRSLGGSLPQSDFERKEFANITFMAFENLEKNQLEIRVIQALDLRRMGWCGGES